MKKDTARILITSECNLNCSYCCNKIPEVQNKIKFVTYDEICNFKYKNYCITGGEPILAFDKLCKIVTQLKTVNKGNVYLYTNGLLLNSGILAFLSNFIDGINVGVHEHKVTNQYFLDIYKEILRKCDSFNVPVRFYVEDKYKDSLDLNAEIHTWKRNECFNNTKEDWFIY
jgi:molybdenum cofactor biosynthesis enzyme MoaA